MAWTHVEWACGHHGNQQMFGKTSSREAEVARQAGRKCYACWLVEKWEAEGDPRAKREDRYILAGKIAEGKGIRIIDLPETAPTEIENPLAKYSIEELEAEIARRK